MKTSNEKTYGQRMIEALIYVLGLLMLCRAIVTGDSMASTGIILLLGIYFGAGRMVDKIEAENNKKNDAG